MTSTPSGNLANFIKDLRGKLHESLGRIVVGQNSVIDQMLMALLASGHVLLEGVPGTAKTTLCRAFSKALGLHFERVQFTPDLLPSDVTGTQVLDRQSSTFVLRKGPIFCQILLADELNRAPARTQSSLLEAMQEKQVTIEGKTLLLPDPFMVLATQNPIEQEGVYRLPEAQLDRFLFRIHVGYPNREEELRMLQLHSQRANDVPILCSEDSIRSMQLDLDNLFCSPEIHDYIIDLARATRAHSDLLLGASPRAAIYLLKASRAKALIEGRSYTSHADVQAILRPVLGHRLILKPESEMDGQTVEKVIERVMQSVPVVEIRSSR